MNLFLENLKKEVEANPTIALGVGAALLTGTAKLMNANIARRNAKTYKKEIDRRIKNLSK